MTNRTCCTPDCGNDVLARGMCRRHYMAWRESNPDKVRRYLSTDGECSVSECEELRSAKGMCRRHYNQWSYSKKPRLVPEVGVCRRCGQEFSRKERFATSRVYCSSECQKEAKAASSRESYQRRKREIGEARRSATRSKLAGIIKECPYCSAKFSPERSSSQKFCSKACGANYHRDSSARICEATDCDRPVRAREMCSMHYRRWARQTGRERPESWSQERYERWKRRQDRKRETQVEPIRNLDVFERDGWRCGICDDLIDRSLVWPDPLCVTLDHIIPLSEGGTHTWDNVQAAHARCNIQKGSSLAA